jgi:hypothetical protein
MLHNQEGRMINNQYKLFTLITFIFLVPVFLYSQINSSNSSAQYVLSNKINSIEDLKPIKTVELSNSEIQKAGVREGYELFFSEPLLLDGIIKTITLSFVNENKDTDVALLSLLLKSTTGIPYRLEDRELRFGKNSITWIVPPYILYAYNSEDKPEISGFRIYTTKEILNDISFQNLDYLTDEFALPEQDPDMLNWNDSLSLSDRSNKEIKTPEIMVPGYLQKVPLPRSIEGDYEALSDIFGNPLGYGGSPGFFLIRDELIHSLFLTNPKKAVTLFQSFGPRFWEIIPINRFFQIIGYQYSYLFDNLYLHSEYSFDRGENMPLLLAADYADKSDYEIGKYLRFWDFSRFMEPEDYLHVYKFCKERNLPLNNLILHLKNEGKMLRNSENEFRSLTFKERLFRSLLLRLNIVEKLPHHPMDAVLTIPGSLQPFYELDKSVANFYSGNPESADLKSLQSLLLVPITNRLYYGRILLLAPENIYTSDMEKILTPLILPYNFEDLRHVNSRLPTKPYTARQIIEFIDKRMLQSPHPEKVESNAYGYKDSYFNQYHFNLDFYPTGYSVKSPELVQSEDFNFIESINLLIKDLNSSFIITLLMESEDGILWEAYLGKTGFYGIRNQYSKISQLPQIPKSRFVELRVYHIPSDSMFEIPQYPVPFNIGKLLIESDGVKK